MTRTMNAKDKKKYLEQFPDVTVKENLHSRLIEMWGFQNPPEDYVKHLLSKGLLKKPHQKLIELYPHLFTT